MTCFYIFSVLFDFLHLRLCHSGRFCLVGTNSPRRFPLERKENVSLVLLGRCGSMWIWSFRCCWRHHDFVVFGLITAVPVDTKNTWQALNHAVTTQDVERVDLSVVHKELQDKQWFDSEGHVIRWSCDQKVMWSEGRVIRRSCDQKVRWSDIDKWLTFPSRGKMPIWKENPSSVSLYPPGWRSVFSRRSDDTTW